MASGINAARLAHGRKIATTPELHPVNCLSEQTCKEKHGKNKTIFMKNKLYNGKLVILISILTRRKESLVLLCNAN